MPLKLGSISIGEVYLGSVKIAQIYLGSTLVYQSAPTPEPVLPDAYRAIPYLICTGEQYIDTGIKVAAGGKYAIKAQKADDNTNKPIMGDGKSAYQGNYAIWLNAQKAGYGTRASFGDTAANYKVDEADATPHPSTVSAREYVMDIENRTLHIDGTLVGTATAKKGLDQTSKLFIAGCSRNGAIYDYFTGDMYTFKAWVDNVLVRNMVPCVRKQDNKPGEYDFVTSTFYPSTSGVDFLVPEAGLDEETLRHISLVYGDYLVFGSVPETEEEARSRAMITE